MVTFHHIYTRKAYPELSETPWNMMPVCLICHNKIHGNGLVEFCKNWKNAESWLISNNWYFDNFFEKWRHENE
jgi:5-methylcytosine-specific restriction endonuclease McrA